MSADEADEKADERTGNGQRGGGKSHSMVVMVVIVAAILAGMAFFLVRSVQESEHEQMLQEPRVVEVGTIAPASDANSDVPAELAANADGSYGREGASIQGSPCCWDASDKSFVLYDENADSIVRVETTGKTSVICASVADGLSMNTFSELLVYQGRIYVLGMNEDDAGNRTGTLYSFASDGSDVQKLWEDTVIRQPGYLCVVDGGSLNFRLDNFDSTDDVPNNPDTLVSMNLDGTNITTAPFEGAAMQSVVTPTSCWYCRMKTDEAEETSYYVDLHQLLLDGSESDQIVASDDGYARGLEAAGETAYLLVADENCVFTLHALGDDGEKGSVTIDPHDVLGDDVVIDSYDLRACLDVTHGRVFIYASFSVEGKSPVQNTILMANLDGSDLTVVQNLGQPNGVEMLSSGDGFLLYETMGPYEKLTYHVLDLENLIDGDVAL